MALTVSLSGDWLSSFGNKRASSGTITFDSSYATGGESLTPANIGLGTIERITFNHGEDGYVFKYDYTNQKVMAYRTATLTPTGTISAPTFTGSALAAHAHNILVKGSAAGGIDEPIGVEGTDTLAKDAATDRTILGADSATKGGVIAITGGTPAGTVSAPTFTGAATTAAALAEVGAATNLSAVVVEFMAIGY